MGRGTCQATVCRVAQSQTHCSNLALMLESDRLPLHHEVTGVGSFLTSLQGLTMLFVHKLYLDYPGHIIDAAFFFFFSFSQKPGLLKYSI